MANLYILLANSQWGPLSRSKCKGETDMRGQITQDNTHFANDGAFKLKTIDRSTAVRELLPVILASTERRWRRQRKSQVNVKR